ncbi:HNH endonuclease [Rhizobium rhizogenes]|uniref:HNH endonuclease n=1 Tax=Rhizobium rhizogenes TaxID=359 RepID=UPI001AF3A98B|nr:HNH endonuclease [Rhizobium rhizogenes]
MKTAIACAKCGSFERRPRGNCAQCHRDAGTRYRNRLKAAEGNHTTAEWLAKAATYVACPKCNRSWQDVERPNGQHSPFTKGHITPLAQGGTNDIDNLQPECARCNYADHGAQLTRQQTGTPGD